MKAVPADTHFTYGYNQWNTTITNPRGKQKNYLYDALGNLVSVIEQNYNTTSQQIDHYQTYYQYDILGNLIHITDDQGYEYQVIYDDLGRKKQQIDPNAGTWDYTYNPIGLLDTMTDAQGYQTRYSYDSLNRPTRIIYHDTSMEKIYYDGDHDSETGDNPPMTLFTDSFNTDDSWEHNDPGKMEHRIRDAATWTKRWELLISRLYPR